VALHGIMPESVVLHDHWTINEKNMIIIVPMFSQDLCYDNYQTPFSHKSFIFLNNENILLK
jgi:hypothetical protein